MGEDGLVAANVDEHDCYIQCCRRHFFKCAFYGTMGLTCTFTVAWLAMQASREAFR